MSLYYYVIREICVIFQILVALKPNYAQKAMLR